MKRHIWRDFIGGVLLVFTAYAVVVTLIIALLWLVTLLQIDPDLLSRIGFAIAFLPGVSQLIYLMPIVIHFWKKQRWEVLKGMGTGAVLMILVNAVCYSFVDSALRKW